MKTANTTPESSAAATSAVEIPKRFFITDEQIAEAKKACSARLKRQRRGRAKTCPTPHKAHPRCRPRTIIRANRLPIEAFLLGLPLHLPADVILSLLEGQLAYQLLSRKRALELHKLVKQRVAYGQALLEVERVIHQGHSEGWSLPVFVTKLATLGYELMATEHGVAVRQLPDTWIFEPEYASESLMAFLQQDDPGWSSFQAGSLELKLLAVRLDWLKRCGTAEGLTDAACRRILPAVDELEHAVLLDAVDQAFRRFPGSNTNCARSDHFAELLEPQVKNTWFSPEFTEMVMASLNGPAPHASDQAGDDRPSPLIQ